MRSIVGWFVILATAMLVAGTARAHSIEELQAMLLKSEEYFQPVDELAPGFMLADAAGNTVRLADFRGKVVVLHFIYASCPDVCPLHADRIAEIQAMVNRTPMKDRVQFISISTDPEHDTPEILGGYGPVHRLNSANWVFLTTAPDQPADLTRRLVEAYGHKFARTESGMLVHGVVTHVIDKEGQLRGNFYGLEFAPTNMTIFINALTNDVQHPHFHKERSLWDKLRDFF
jgi:protein SCO1